MALLSIQRNYVVVLDIPSSPLALKGRLSASATVSMQYCIWSAGGGASKPGKVFKGVLKYIGVWELF